MTIKHSIRRGTTFLLPGRWESGDPFDEGSTVTFKLIRNAVEVDVPVTLINERDLSIYASNEVTAGWEKGAYNAILTRTDAGYFPNGDDWVHDTETFVIEVT